MIQPELQLPVRWGEKGVIKGLIKDRPRLPALQVGYHLRNAEEALDLLDLLNEVVPERAYVGLAGGRQAGKIFHTKEKISRRFKDQLSRKTIRAIADKWPTVAKDVCGNAINLIPGVTDSNGKELPANAFFYDLDAIVIPREFNAESILHPIVGSRSGTRMDLFIVSQANLLRSTHGFYRSIFTNSQRLSPIAPKVIA